jgi:hypothetical protein
LPLRGEVTGQHVVQMVGEKLQTFHALVPNLTQFKKLLLNNKQDQMFDICLTVHL